MKILAFTGKQGSGKTEAAKLIALMLEARGFRAVVVKFADPIYKIMQAQCDVLHLDFDKPKMRHIMQFIGEHYRKVYGENFWIDRWEMELKHAGMFSVSQPEAVYICDDLRYKNEAQKVVALGGVIVEVSATDETRKSRIEVVGSDHASEKGINYPVNYTVHNNGTVEELASQLQLLADRV